MMKPIQQNIRNLRWCNCLVIRYIHAISDVNSENKLLKLN